MKRLNKKTDVGQMIMDHFATDKKDPLVGSVVRFVGKQTKYPAYQGLFEIIGTQRVWGYDKDNQYTMIDGYRVMSITYHDHHGLGIPCAPYEIEIVSSNS